MDQTFDEILSALGLTYDDIEAFVPVGILQTQQNQGAEFGSPTWVAQMFLCAHWHGVINILPTEIQSRKLGAELIKVQTAKAAADQRASALAAQETQLLADIAAAQGS